MTEIAGFENVNPAVTLVRYSQIIGYSEYAFFGMRHGSNANYACRNIWSRYDRDTIASYLQSAQDEIEQIIGYALSPRWFANEQHKYKNPILTDLGKLLALGEKKSEVLGSGTAVSYLTDPPTVTVIVDPLQVTGVEDIHVFYPGTDIEILPSSMTLTGDSLVIVIPKSRLLDSMKFENPSGGWDSADVSIFQTTVDVIRWTTDPTNQAFIIYDPCECAPDCLTTEASVCAIIEDSEVGIVRLGRPALTVCPTGEPRRVRVNYRAGLSSLSRHIEMAIVRLAHSRMPTEPCGCDVTQRLWSRDRNEPKLLDRERLNCPFGTSDGAWAAWRIAQSIANYRLSEFVGHRHGYH